jgi:radical SAM-linked protein
MRGCVKGCRFCQAGYVYRPLRERNPEDVVAQTTELMARTGYEEVSLLSLSTGDYSGVNPVLKALMDRLAPERIAVSLPSTRVDALSPKILEQIRRVRKTGFTLAPEAGTQRLRDVIQKEYREEELLAAAKLFADLGWRSLKLYFMIGLPSETEEDVRGIALLAERVKRAAGGRLAVTASVSTFSPKPHTPFQWAGELSIAETQARQALLRRELGRRGIEFKWHDAHLSWLEGVFARGDRRLADVIETAQARGARFDGWSDQCRIPIWEEALAAHGLDPEFYLRRRPLAEALPWDHLDAGLSKKFLQQDLARAVEGQLTPDCSVERCTYCGACDFDAVRNVDYHPEGAKGTEHRGAAVSRWAEMLVPADDVEDPLPAWETRMWRSIRTRVAARRAAREPVAPRPVPAGDAPLPAMLAGRETAAGPLTGEGNAEEWLGAVPSSLEPPTAAAPVVQRVRVRYRKIGPARFIGTRELGTIFARAVRRARLPVGFSNGHHPLPRIGFGPALPVGVSSDDELVDLELTAPCAPADVLSVLARELPDGLLPLAADEIARSAPSIDQSTTGNLYDVDVAELDEPPTPDAVAAAVERFHASDRLLVRKHTKGGERLVDGRPLVVSLAQTGPATLALELAAGPAGTLKPNMVVAALLDLPADAAPLLRIHKRTTRFASDPAARDAASLV